MVLHVLTPGDWQCVSRRSRRRSRGANLGRTASTTCGNLIATVVASAVAAAEPPAPAASSTAIAAAAPVAAPGAGLGAEGGGHLLLGLEQDLHQVLGHLRGLVGEEGHGQALGACSARTADAVDVVLDVVGPMKSSTW